MTDLPFIIEGDGEGISVCGQMSCKDLIQIIDYYMDKGYKHAKIVSTSTPQIRLSKGASCDRIPAE